MFLSSAGTFLPRAKVKTGGTGGFYLFAMLRGQLIRSTAAALWFFMSMVVVMANAQLYGGGVGSISTGLGERHAQYMTPGAGENIDDKVRVPLKPPKGTRVNVATTVYDAEMGLYTMLSTKLENGVRVHYMEIYDVWLGDPKFTIKLNWPISMLEYDIVKRIYVGLATVAMPPPTSSSKPLLGHEIVTIEIKVDDNGRENIIQAELRAIPPDASPIMGLSALDSVNGRLFLVVRTSRNDMMEVEANGAFSHASNMMLYGYSHRTDKIVVYEPLTQRVSVFLFDNLRGILWGIRAGTKRGEGGRMIMLAQASKTAVSVVDRTKKNAIDPELEYPSFFSGPLNSEMAIFDAMLDHQTKDFRMVMRGRPDGPNTFARQELVSVNQDTKKLTKPWVKDYGKMIPRNNGTLPPEFGVHAKWDIINPDAHMKIIQETPPPKVREARFAASGAWFSVTFDISTDMGGQAGSFLPSRLLEEESAKSLGKGARCSWESSSRLIFFIGAGSAIEPGTSKLLWRKVVVDMKGRVLPLPNNLPGVRGVEIIGGTVFPSKRFLVGSFVPQGPKFQIDPLVVLQAPSSLSMCDDLTLDGSLSYNHGGRPYFKWNLISVAGEAESSPRTASLQAFVEKINNSSFTLGLPVGFSLTSTLNVEKSMITPNSYFTFELIVLSFFNTQASKQVTIFISSLPIPSILLVGAAERTSFGPKVLRLSAAGELSKCMDGDANIMWEWTLVSVSNSSGGLEPSLRFPVDPRSSVTKTLMVPERTMRVGFTYLFKAKGSLDVFPDVFSTVTATVKIIPSNLNGVITGGNRLVGRAGSFQVDGLNSFDPDAPSILAKDSMSFVWDCHVQGWPDIGCFSQIGNNTHRNATFIFPREAVVEFPAYTFLPGFYTLVMRIMKDTRLTTTETNIEIVGGDPPSVFIDPLPKTKVLSTETIRLKGIGKSNDPTFNQLNLKYKWVLQGGLLDMSAASMTPLNSPVFAFRSNVLTPGSIYTMRLEATDFDGTGYGDIDLIVATPPAGGTFTTFPLVGTALSTEFTLEASASWTADDLPLVYDFSYQTTPPEDATSPLDEAKLTQNPVSSRKFVTNMLPTGEGDGNQLRTVCYIISSVGASTRQTVDVTVSTIEGDDAVGSMGNILSDTESAGDPSEVMLAIQGIGSTLGSITKEEVRRRRRRRRLLGENVDDTGGMTEADCAGDQKCLDDLVERQVMRENLLETMGSQDLESSPESLDVQSKALKTMGGDGETSPEFNSEAMSMLNGMVSTSQDVGMSNGASGTSPMAGDVVGSVSGVIQSDSGEAAAEQQLLAQGGGMKGSVRRLAQLRDIRRERRRRLHDHRKRLGLAIPHFVHRRLAQYLRESNRGRGLYEDEIAVDIEAKKRAEDIAGMMDNLGGQTIGEALPGEESVSINSPNLMIQNKRSFASDFQAENSSETLQERRRRLNKRRRLSGDGASKGDFDLPGGLLNGINGTGDTVESAQAGYTTNPYAYSEATSADEKNSPVCGLKMKAGGGQLDISGLGSDSLIGVACGEPNDLTVCSYWDKEANKGMGGWSTKGVINDGGICYTSHLTDFSPVGDSNGVELNAVDPIADAAAIGKLDTSNMGPVIILGVLWLLYIVGTVGGYYYDHKHRKAWRENAQKERRAARQKVRDEMRKKRKLARIPAKVEGNPLDIDKEAAASKSKKPISKWAVLSSSVNGSASETESPAASAAWGAVMEQMGFGEHVNNIKETVADEFKEGHSLLSIWYVKPDDRYTRPQRLTVLMCLILGQTALSALFFGLEEGDSEEGAVDGQAMMVGMVCSMIMFPVEKVFASMFAQAKPAKKPDPEVVRRKHMRRILKVREKYKEITDLRGRRRKKSNPAPSLAAPAPPKIGGGSSSFIRRLSGGFRRGSQVKNAPPPPPRGESATTTPSGNGRKILIRRSSAGGAPPPPRPEGLSTGTRPPPPKSMPKNRLMLAPGEIAQMRNTNSGGKAPPPPPPPGGGPAGSAASRIRSGFQLRQAAKKTLEAGAGPASPWANVATWNNKPPAPEIDEMDEQKMSFKRKMKSITESEQQNNSSESIKSLISEINNAPGPKPATRPASTDETKGHLPPPAAPPGKGVIKRKVFNQAHATTMDLDRMESLLAENPEMANQIINNPSIPEQVKERARKIHIVHSAKQSDKTKSLAEKRNMDRKILKKKMKYRRRERLAKQYRKLKRHAMRAARKLNRWVAWMGSFLFILVATFFCLIYSVKFEPAVAMAWISASMLGTLQGWILLEPFEIVIGATKGEWTDSMKDVYMEKMGGERLQAAMYKSEDQTTKH